jgi:hypothetical protein
VGLTPHLDPDLSAGGLPRMSGWSPLLGQEGAALFRQKLGDVLAKFSAVHTFSVPARCSDSTILVLGVVSDGNPKQAVICQQEGGCEQTGWTRFAEAADAGRNTCRQ